MHNEVESVPLQSVDLPDLSGAMVRETYLPRLFIPHVDIPRLLVLIPGSRSHGQWCMDVQRASEQEAWGVEVRAVTFCPPRLSEVILFPRQRLQRRQVKQQLDQIFSEAPRNCDIFVAAHSFGTELLIDWLREHVGVLHQSRAIYRVESRIAAAFLINGIVKRTKVAYARPTVNILVNHAAVDDRLPSWAAGLAPRAYDDIGTTGVRSGAARVVDRFFAGDHGTLVGVEHFREHVLPVINGLGVPDAPLTGPTVHELFVRNVTLLKWCVFVVAIAVVIAATWLFIR